MINLQIPNNPYTTGGTRKGVEVISEKQLGSRCSYSKKRLYDCKPDTLVLVYTDRLVTEVHDLLTREPEELGYGVDPTWTELRSRFPSTGGVVELRICLVARLSS
ncbi:MAG: hypothetical protein JWQ74_3697, partial [Marmoricola sp.]|nr:hypothetical protein [Marmoricola sp.]